MYSTLLPTYLHKFKSQHNIHSFFEFVFLTFRFSYSDQLVKAHIYRKLHINFDFASKNDCASNARVK